MVAKKRIIEVEQPKTPEEQTAYERRIANLQLARSKAKILYAEKKTREDDINQKIKTKELKEKIEGTKKEEIKILLEPIPAQEQIQTFIPEPEPPKTPPKTPKPPKPKPKKQPKIIYIDENSSDEEDRQIVVMRKKKQPPIPVIPHPIQAPPVEDQINKMSNREIASQMRKLQIELLSKSMWD